MISRAEALRITNTYLGLPKNQIGNIKIPIYRSLIKRVKVKIIKIFGWLTSRYYLIEKLVEPDDWLIKLDKLVILDDGIYEGQYCWLIAFNSATYNESKDLMDLILGIGPLIIDKYTGEIYETGAGDDDVLSEFINLKLFKHSRIDWKAREIQL